MFFPCSHGFGELGMVTLILDAHFVGGPASKSHFCVRESIYLVRALFCFHCVLLLLKLLWELALLPLR